MTAPDWTRRGLLAAMGWGAGSLALPRRARAAGPGDPPTRFLLFYTSQGSVPDRWTCDPRGLGDDHTWSDDWSAWDERDFSESLRPLYRWRSDVTAIAGLGLVSAEADGASFRHERSQAHGLSGANATWVNGYPYGGAPSIDQIIADHVARPDHYRSIEVSVARGLSYDGYGSAVYRGRAQPLPTIDDPRALWDRLFAGRGPEAGAVSRHQGSVLDAVAGRYAAVAPSLSPDARRKLELHGDLVRDLERRLQGVHGTACPSAPGRAEHTGDPDGDLDHHLALLAAAFSCDLTRVASIQMGQLTMEQIGQPAGNVHADLAHDIYTSAAAADGMAAYTAHHARQFGRILDILDRIPEGDGTLLDSTVVAWIPELADSWHGMDRFPIVLGGGRRTRLQTGRYVSYAPTSLLENAGPFGVRATMGVPHQRALVSICRAMGMGRDRVGEAAVRGTDGAPIDCTGALPELWS